MKKSLFLFFILLLASFPCFAEKNQKKIALLFLTRSDLNQPKIWKKWVDPRKCTVYNHSKSIPKDPWLAKYRIKNIQPNEWGFLLLPQQALLQEALKNPLNEKFIFLSESCIPLRSCKETHKILLSFPESQMCWNDIWWRGDPARTLTEFPPEHHLGNHQWIILNRKHAELMANDNYWIHLANNHICSDEAYPATFFSMCGVLDEFRNELTTYVDWFRGSPYTFCEDNEENEDALIQAKCSSHGIFGASLCLFARKFSKDYPEEKIRAIIKFKSMSPFGQE
ncbi:MAG: hypothetical protein BGO10_06200 [Chlamydia sp. 32-24]|nr:MAG: hypothetical protein BGO10_06200 [Chlamydia sp. 32-24]